MKDHTAAAGAYNLILEENVGPINVEVSRIDGVYRAAMTLTGQVDMPGGAPSPADLAQVLTLDSAEIDDVFFAGVGVPFCFAKLVSIEAVDRATVDRSAWAKTLSGAWSSSLFFFLPVL
jgi:predicted PhzF superfamily epimerase YddE/YHI9